MRIWPAVLHTRCLIAGAAGIVVLGTFGVSRAIGGRILFVRRLTLALRSRRGLEDVLPELHNGIAIGSRQTGHALVGQWAGVVGVLEQIMPSVDHLHDLIADH